MYLSNWVKFDIKLYQWLLSSYNDNKMTWNNYTGNYLLTFQLQCYEVCLIVFIGVTEVKFAGGSLPH